MPLVIGSLKRAADKHANALLWLGLTAIACYNLRKRCQDRALVLHVRADMAGGRPALKAMPRVSILVAAWNEAEFIERHIRSVQALRYLNKEYVVCAGGADGTYDVACRHAGSGVRVLEQLPGEGKQASLNRAFQHASGDVIYLTDADCLLNDDAFERVLAALVSQDSAVAASGGVQPLPEQQASRFVSHQWSEYIYSLSHLPPSVAGLVGANCAVRRQALVATGALSEAVPTGTDSYLAKRLLAHGGTIVHVSTSLVATVYPESWQAYSRQQSRWLRNVVLHSARFGALNEARAALSTSLIGLTMLVLPILAIWAGPVIRNVWLLAFAQAYLGKLRYYRVAEMISGQPRAMPGPAAAALYTSGEFVIWTVPLLQLMLSPWKPLSW